MEVAPLEVGDSYPYQLLYPWVPEDWDEVGANGLTGGLILSPDPLLIGEVGHRMEYEVTAPSGRVLTFPNHGFDTLLIGPDIL